MDISSGTEFVWRLAASEAIATRRENIEPDHFFCALLMPALDNGPKSVIMING